MLLLELFQEIDSRPEELGEAYFFIDGTVVGVGNFRNHRDWLIAHKNVLGLPDYVLQKPSKALFEAYKLGVIRLVWDQGGKWNLGSGKGQGNVLYINGIDKIVWKSMSRIMNYPLWAGQIDTVVIEYLDVINDKPSWQRSDMYTVSSLGVEGFEDLYRGRKPRPARF